MTQRCYPLNDVEYLAKDLRMFHIGRATGVINATGRDFETKAGIGMQTVVSKGYAYLLTGTNEFGGVVYGSDAEETFSHSPADALLDRIDAIIIRYNALNNSCNLVKVEGIPSSKPTPYKPVRNANTFELVLQYVKVNHGISAITNALIEPQILNEELCGLAVDTLAKIPTAQYDEQIQAWKQENQVAFDEWFATIQDILDGNVAGNLQNEIDANKRAIAVNTRDIETLRNGIAKTANHNLLNNGYFQIWLKGNSVSVGNFGGTFAYTASRWCIKRKNTTISKVSGGLKSNASVELFQLLPAKLARGKTYTLSCSINGGTSSFTFTANGMSQTNGRLTYVVEREAQGYSGVSVQISSSDILNWVKLEVGDTATPFVAKEFSAELQECFRYYYPLKEARFTVTQVLRNQVWAGFTLPTYMRIQPKPTITSVKLRNKAGGVISTTGTTGATILEFPNDQFNIGVGYSGESAVDSDPYLSLSGSLDAEIY